MSTTSSVPSTASRTPRPLRVIPHSPRAPSGRPPPRREVRGYSGRELLEYYTRLQRLQCDVAEVVTTEDALSDSRSAANVARLRELERRIPRGGLASVDTVIPRPPAPPSPSPPRISPPPQDEETGETASRSVGERAPPLVELPKMPLECPTHTATDADAEMLAAVRRWRRQAPSTPTRDAVFDFVSSSPHLRAAVARAADLGVYHVLRRRPDVVSGKMRHVLLAPLQSRYGCTYGSLVDRETKKDSLLPLEQLARHIRGEATLSRVDEAMMSSMGSSITMFLLSVLGSPLDGKEVVSAMRFVVAHATAAVVKKRLLTPPTHPQGSSVLSSGTLFVGENAPRDDAVAAFMVQQRQEDLQRVADALRRDVTELLEGLRTTAPPPRQTDTSTQMELLRAAERDVRNAVSPTVAAQLADDAEFAGLSREMLRLERRRVATAIGAQDAPMRTTPRAVDVRRSQRASSARVATRAFQLGALSPLVALHLRPKGTATSRVVSWTV